jgi:MinD superfamily P-loop ATPase
MVHARLGVAEENSGKLVSFVRHGAKKIAEKTGIDTILIDGPPGIGCPVIASITGVDLVLLVTEPTVAGIHDLARISELTSHFKIPTVVCINKWDINPELTAAIEQSAANYNAEVIGKIHYDNVFTRAQVECTTVVEFAQNGITEEIRRLWGRLISKG